MKLCYHCEAMTADFPCRFPPCLPKASFRLLSDCWHNLTKNGFSYRKAFHEKRFPQSHNCRLHLWMVFSAWHLGEDRRKAFLKTVNSLVIFFDVKMNRMNRMKALARMKDFLWLHPTSTACQLAWFPSLWAYAWGSSVGGKPGKTGKYIYIYMCTMG